MIERRHFESGGAVYAEHRPDYPTAVVDVLLRNCARTTHALDVGCGTGQLAVRLGGHFERVTAIDPSASQIANAIGHKNVHYAIGAAERIELEGGSVDLIVAAQAAHWFDLALFYPEVRRVAAAGAVLALLSYGVPAIDDECRDAFDAFYNGPLHAFWPPERRHVETGYRTLSFPFKYQSVPTLAIERLWSWYELEAYIGTWSATKRAVSEGAIYIARDGLAEVARKWGDPAIKRCVRWPVAMRIARALPQ